MSRAVLGVLTLLLTAACTASRSNDRLSPVPPAEAVVRPGDRLVINAYREAELSDTLTVDPLGIVRVPRVGALAVEGRSVLAVQDSIRVALSTFLRNPSIEVRVLRRVAVQGEVRRPDLYLVDLTTTLQDVIALAGGVTPDGNPADVVIVRGGERHRVSGGRDAVYRREELLSGDQVVVGQRSWISRNVLAVAGTVAVTLPTLLLVIDRVGRN
jgi:protein involved in polysaccharide export with SLBB domain